MENSFRKILIVMLAIVIAAAFAVTFLYIRSLDKRNGSNDSTVETVSEVSKETETDTTSKKTDVVSEPKATEEPINNPIKSEYENGEHLLTPENVRSVVLRSKDEEIGNFRFEMFINSEGEATFTGWYQGTEAEVRCSDQLINASRMDDVSDIIERHTVVKEVEAYMNNPEGYKPQGGDLSGLEITFSDGHHADFGFPNGAGKEMARYFKSLTDWLSTMEN